MFWYCGLDICEKRNGSRCLYLGRDGFLHVGVCHTALNSQVIPCNSTGWKLRLTLPTVWLLLNSTCVPIQCSVTCHYWVSILSRLCTNVSVVLTDGLMLFDPLRDLIPVLNNAYTTKYECRFMQHSISISSFTSGSHNVSYRTVSKWYSYSQYKREHFRPRLQESSRDKTWTEEIKRDRPNETLSIM
jgi:hypothetical protein